LTSLLLALLLSQNGVSVTNRTVDKAIAVRCVTPDGGGYESCAGGGGGTNNITVGAVGQGAGSDGGLAWNVAGTVSVSNLPASQAVTGSFWQSTQPVSIASMPSTPVTGTFWPAIQPVSGTVSVSSFPASQAVTGTFWQTTQPVSLASAPTTPVTGTFWQTTQPVSGPATDTQLRATPLPVSGTVTASVSNFPGTQAVGVTGPVTDTQLRASPVPVSGTFFQGTQPVSLATAPTTPVTGTVAVSNQPVPPAVTTNNVLYVFPVAPPINPFLSRCNAVRRTNCQP
jgi:hypothetical protein